MKHETKHIFQEEAPLKLSIQLIVFLLKTGEIICSQLELNRILIYDDKCLTKTFYLKKIFFILD